MAIVFAGLNRHPLRNTLVLLLFHLIRGLARLVPLRAVPGAAAVLGDLARWSLPQQRRRVREHLLIAFPGWTDAKRERCLKANFRHYGLLCFELLKADRLLGRVEAEGLEHLARRPLVLATGHIGPWELFGQWLGTHGYPLSAVAREVYLPALNAYLVGRRARANFTTIIRGGPQSGRLLLQAIKEGRVLAMLIDQDTKVEAVHVPFFGRPASTPVGAAGLALRKGLPVVAGVIHRLPGMRYRITLRPVAAEGLDETALTARMTAELETAIRRHPTQWVWVHRRWRRQPPHDPLPPAH
jgi:KDO2-lipid IV(A) lauroyltransferase